MNSKYVVERLQIILLLLVTVVVVEGVVMETRGWHDDRDMWGTGNEVCLKTMTNGCSAPGPLKMSKYNEIFLHACNRHDVCYECVSISFFVRKKHLL